jgi:soluble lytic murein transglycosylase-like protein
MIAKVKSVFPIGFALIMLLGGAWLVVTGKWLDTSTQVFSGASGLSHTQAQAIYRESITALQAKNFATAVKGFKQLLPTYTMLQPIIALHLAEAYEGLPNERQAQLTLKDALDKNPEPLLEVKLLYALASSDFRAKEYKQAKERFTQLQQIVNRSATLQTSANNEQIAAHYFLGLMGLQQVEGLTQAEGIHHLSRYIVLSPEGRFVSFAALALRKALPKPTPTQQALIGVGLANNPEYAAEAVRVLTPLPRKDTWLALAKAQVQSQQPGLAVKTVLDSYCYAQTKPQAEAALALLIAHGKPLPNLLTTLTRSRTPMGDMALWELTDAGTSNNLTWYRQIVQQYPKGDYAPESSWRLLWAKQQDPTAFIEAAEAHEQLFKTSRSYPRVLFWHAKMLEQQHRPHEAISLYTQLSQQFKTNYYGYRAKARLLDISHQGNDLAWQLNRQAPFPETVVDMPMPSLLKEHPLAGAIDELADMGQTDDAKLLAEAAFDNSTLSADDLTVVNAWIDWRTGYTVKALRALRAQIDATQLAGESLNSELLAMAYPLKYADLINRFTRETKVDPYLVSALMREESSFNPAAVSLSNAYGLMQLLLPTANEQVDAQDRPLEAKQLFDPRLNIKAGTRYVAWLFNFSPLNNNPRNVVAAYNAGPGQVSTWLNTINTDPDAWVESLPAEETRDYIRRVFTSYWTYTSLYASN